MTEKWGQIQGKWDLVRVSGRVRVIRVRVTGVLLYILKIHITVPLQSVEAANKKRDTIKKIERHVWDEQIP